ncbi:unnamed protein product [Cuscuta campestris]|uniref:Uncharacterized protein n=1 Tax=Cuscuta campestris TaxID=132261 RepID=A0A484LG97_9ASTE|nr:unnamed protein product [Cuscuta campestris]
MEAIRRATGRRPATKLLRQDGRIHLRPSFCDPACYRMEACDRRSERRRRAVEFGNQRLDELLRRRLDEFFRDGCWSSSVYFLQDFDKWSRRHAIGPTILNFGRQYAIGTDNDTI